MIGGGVVYRYQRFSLSASGISPVKVKGVENIDCSGIIEGHQEYSRKLRDVLRLVKLDDGAFTYHLPIPERADLDIDTTNWDDETEEAEASDQGKVASTLSPSSTSPHASGNAVLRKADSVIENTVLY